MKSEIWAVAYVVLIGLGFILAGFAIGHRVYHMDLQDCISNIKTYVDITNIDLIQLEAKTEACKLLFNEE